MTGPLYTLEREDRKHLEKRLRPKPPFMALAAKLNDSLGLELSDEQEQRFGKGLHWGYGAGWGALYGLLRQRVPVLRRGLGLPFAVAFTLVGDELLNTTLGLTGPASEFPWEAHARGFAGHAGFTAAAELTCRAVEEAFAVAER